MPKRSALTALLATLALGAIGAVAAQGHTVRFFTEPHITETSGYDRDTGLYAYFQGNVESNGPAACRKGRTVQLRDESKAVIATVKTTGAAHGTWRINASGSVLLAHGQSYYLTVPRRVLKSDAKHRHVCRAGRSDPEDF